MAKKICSGCGSSSGPRTLKCSCGFIFVTAKKKGGNPPNWLEVQTSPHISFGLTKNVVQPGDNINTPVTTIIQ